MMFPDHCLRVCPGSNAAWQSGVMRLAVFRTCAFQAAPLTLRHKQTHNTWSSACHEAANTFNEASAWRARLGLCTYVDKSALNERHQMSRCAGGFFFPFFPPPPTEKCWQRARWQGWNEHSVCYVPGVHRAAHSADPGPWIFIVYHAFICVCLCACVCVCDWESQCGSESPAGVWGKKQQEAENPCCLWISVSEQEAEHRAACACALS